jgi:hypothetical protein
MKMPIPEKCGSCWMKILLCPEYLMPPRKLLSKTLILNSATALLLREIQKIKCPAFVG